MAVPFLILGAAGIAALIGIETSAGAIDKNKKADRINENAQGIIDRAKNYGSIARDNSNERLERFGEVKLKVLDNSISRFVNVFDKIHNIKVKDSAGFDELGRFRIDKQSVLKMREMSNMASSVLGGLVGGAGAGALAAFGAYGATMTFAAASTGTAITTLSGAAATNATLAFLGGGALTAGGGGMALGSFVLGSAVAGPAICILGIAMDASASENLDNAYSNEAQAREFSEEMQVVVKICNGIAERADMFRSLLRKLDEIFLNMIARLDEIVNNSGYDYSLYTEDEQNIAAMSMSVAGAIKKVLDTPILNDDGSLTQETLNTQNEMNIFLENKEIKRYTNMAATKERLEEIARKIKDNEELSEENKLKMLRNIRDIQDAKINLIITGATGCGKSSTINALFDCEKAVVGTGPDPETMEIQKYEFSDNLILWDSPGLGDGKDNDIRHSKSIIKLLSEVDENGNGLIDLVMVIVDGSTRDLGTTYQLIKDVIIPNLKGEDKHKRLIVAINKCDAAQSGRGWDVKTHSPDTTLSKYLDEKVASVKERIKKETGLDVAVMYYSAGFKDDYADESDNSSTGQEPPYNLSKLLYFIIQHTPDAKRLVVMENVNEDPKMWEVDDELEDYKTKIEEETERGIFDSILHEVEETSKEWGEVVPVAGHILGAVAGGLKGVVKSVFKIFW